MQRLEQRFFMTADGLAMKWVLTEVTSLRSESSSEGSRDGYAAASAVSVEIRSAGRDAVNVVEQEMARKPRPELIVVGRRRRGRLAA